MSDDYEIGYQEGYADAMAEDVFMRASLDLYDTLAAQGLPILDGVSARWDAAERCFVFHDGAREVRLG